MNIKYILCIILYILHTGASDNKNQQEHDEFVATKEWQVVKKGQKVPKGLHIRINFETGMTEAKLLDKNEEQSKKQGVAKLPQVNYEETNKPYIDKPALKEALKKIKNDEILKPEDIKSIKDKFRTYEELKKDLGDLNLTPKIDAEVLSDLIKEYRKETAKEKITLYVILNIIEDLDFLAHQYDNAIEFVNQNGFNEIIYKNLNLTNTKIKQETLKLFASLVQNNAKVQIHALETGAVGVLLRIISLDADKSIKTRAVSALGCLLRRFPIAQLKFIENGGLSVFSKQFQNDFTKIQVKITTLMTDLLVEHQHALQDDHEELLRQYKLVNLESFLYEHNWCENLNKLLLNIVATDPDDHDSIEKTLRGMQVVAGKCGKLFKSDIIYNLLRKYEALADEDKTKSEEFNNSEYFINLSELCAEILRHIHSNLKTEL